MDLSASSSKAASNYIVQNMQNNRAHLFLSPLPSLDQIYMSQKHGF